MFVKKRTIGRFHQADEADRAEEPSRENLPFHRRNFCESSQPCP